MKNWEIFVSFLLCGKQWSRDMLIDQIRYANKSCKNNRNFPVNMLFKLHVTVLMLYLLLVIYIVSSPLPLKLGRFLVFHIWTKRRDMKKLLRNRGLVEKGGDPLRKRGVSKLFHQLPFIKACFHYYCIFFVW